MLCILLYLCHLVCKHMLVCLYYCTYLRTPYIFTLTYIHTTYTYRSFYKHILGLSVSYHDLELIEPEYYNSMKQILEFPLDALGLELTFSAENHDFGQVRLCVCTHWHICSMIVIYHYMLCNVCVCVYMCMIKYVLYAYTGTCSRPGQGRPQHPCYRR